MRKDAWLLSAALLLGAGAARGQDGQPQSSVGGDEITLKNGGLLRGTVVQVDPGHEVVILVVGDEKPRHVPWSQVADVVRAREAVVPPPVKGFDEDAPAPTTPKPKPKPKPAEPEPPPSPAHVVVLHVETDAEELRVYQPVSRAVALTANAAYYLEEYRDVCKAPCDVAVDRDATYYFAGPGVPTSGDFSLRDRGDRVTADVDAGSTGGLAGGWILTSFGVATLLTGGVLAGLGAVKHAVLEPVAEDGIVAVEESMMPGAEVAGPVMLAGGAAMTAGGIALLVLCRTTFDLSPTDGAAAAADSAAPPWRF